MRLYTYNLCIYKMHLFNNIIIDISMYIYIQIYFVFYIYIHFQNWWKLFFIRNRSQNIFKILHTSKFNSLQSFKAKFKAKRYIENNIRSKSEAQNLTDFSPYKQEHAS